MELCIVLLPASSVGEGIRITMTRTQGHLVAFSTATSGYYFLAVSALVSHLQCGKNDNVFPSRILSSLNELKGM